LASLRPATSNDTPGSPASAAQIRLPKLPYPPRTMTDVVMPVVRHSRTDKEVEGA
jgi:hypothetical protein